MNREFETEAAKSPETIEREIDAQRENIGHIVDALESKFTPRPDVRSGTAADAKQRLDLPDQSGHQCAQ